MIASITGTVLAIHDQSLSIAPTNMGIAYLVLVPSPEKYTLKQEAELLVHMHWSQDSGPALFGFASEAERALFAILLKCNGVGPKMALSLLRELPIGQLILAVETHNIKALSAVKGLGPKKAEQVALQLRSKLPALMKLPGASEQGGVTAMQQVTEALGSLGYSRVEILPAIAHAREESKTDDPFDVLMRKALAYLSKK